MGGSGESWKSIRGSGESWKSNRGSGDYWKSNRGSGDCWKSNRGGGDSGRVTEGVGIAGRVTEGMGLLETSRGRTCVCVCVCVCNEGARCMKPKRSTIACCIHQNILVRLGMWYRSGHEDFKHRTPTPYFTLQVANCTPGSRPLVTVSHDGGFVAVAWPAARRYAVYQQGTSAWRE